MPVNDAISIADAVTVVPLATVMVYMPGALTIAFPCAMRNEANWLDQSTRSVTSSVWPSMKCPVAV